MIPLVSEFIVPLDGHNKQDRETAFDDLRALIRYMYFASWDHLLTFLLQGLELHILSNPS